MGTALFLKELGERRQRDRCLIVERKLVRNRGHHHTQVSAIEGLFPGYDILLLTGASYDGFLPYPARSITADVGKDGRRARRNTYGNPFRRLATNFTRGLYGRPSRFAEELSRTIRDFELEDNDTIVIPSATLDDLSAIVEVYGLRGPGFSPKCHIRFLGPNLGEPSARLREAQLTALLRELPREVHLYCETEEMADYMSNRFEHRFTGGFYLPCTLDPRREWAGQPKNVGAPFRVGVFGMPREEKGAKRIGAIVEAVNRRLQTTSIEFMIQGTESDFRPGGVYATALTTSDHVRISQLTGALEPNEFQRNLLLADAILLPYDASLYCLQGSGLVQDAVAAMRPIVHSRGFSMRYLLQHGNAIDAVTDDDFADAIVELARSGETFSEGCRKARDAFRLRLDHAVLFHEETNGGGADLR